MHVYLRPLSIVFSPAFLHIAPAFTAPELDGITSVLTTRARTTATLATKARRFISMLSDRPNRIQS
jgi:hypothetical protein